MRSAVAALALMATVAACSSSGSGSGSSPKRTASPSPTFTQSALLAVRPVIDEKPLTPGEACPSTDDAFPGEVITTGELVTCDRRDRRVLLLAEAALNQTAVEATTAAKQAKGGWSVFVQLSAQSLRTLAAVTGEDGSSAVAVLFNGVVVSVPMVSGGLQGGLVQIQGLSEKQAKYIAAALNPS
jgi:preprotein translocase subunit SecD